MNRRDFLKKICAGAAAMVLPGCAGRSSGKRLNFVLFLIDDMGWTDAACYGSRFYETPNIDRLAAEGMRFTDAYAACAVCSPTRAAVMTGRYPARVGVTDWIRWGDFEGNWTDPNEKGPTEYVGNSKRKLLCPPNPYWMELEEVTIAEILKTAGYTCCHIGKWHLGHDAWYPQKQGFDFNIAGCHFGMPPSYFDPYRKRKNKRGIPTLKPRREGEYLTDREADEAATFIKEHSDRPFFLYMAHYAVHTPIQAKEEITSRYRTKPRYGQKSARYAAMIQSVDEAVGRIMSALEETKAADRTVIIFTSDNGGLSRFTNNAPLRAGKGWPYEGGIRVPLIIRCPGVVKPGTVSHEPVTSVDYLPTICRLAGAKPPAERQIDGLPLVDHLKSGGTTKLPREAIFWHFPHYRDDIVPYSIVRDGRWKLIRHYEGKTFELFDLEDDISETNDLSKKMAEKVAQLDAKLTGWLKEVGAKLPKPKPGPTSAK
ncbi:MAG: sulfatase-like hydrolase/transferase [Planctomycetota bacterium]|jgi:arylsulfatase A-like enzyme